jgi:chorismate--pyruvate lyase
MMPRMVSHAHWHAHANGVQPSPQMRHWLTDRASLTVKLIGRSVHFRARLA